MRNKNGIKALLLATVFIGVMLLMKPTQDTGDDAFIAWQLSRGFGSIGSFISPFLSVIVSGLYQYIPEIPWWSAIHIASAWILLIVMNSIIMKQYTHRERFLLYLILFVSVWISVVKKVNFTRTAAAFSLAGIVLIVKYTFVKLYSKSHKLLGVFLGYLLYLFGCMIRLQAGLMILPFVLIFGLLKINETHYKDNVNRKSIEKFIVLMAPLCISILLIIAENAFWGAHTEWKAYNEYNSVRSSIVDYVDHYPTWEQSESQYIKSGLKEKNDLNLLLDKAFVGDTDVYSLETLKNIQKLSDKEMDLKEVKIAAHKRIKQMLNDGLVLPWLILLMMYMGMIVKTKNRLVFPLNLSVAFAILGVFSLSGRMMLRVWEPILLCVISMIILYYDNKAIYRYQSKNKKNIRKVIIILSGVFLVFYCGLSRDILSIGWPTYSDDRDEITRARAEYIESTPNRLYLLSQPLIHHPPNPSFYGIWEPLPADFCDNYFALSNWDSRTPANLKQLSQKGIKNPVKALLERTDTYSEFMDDKLLQFLKCHYGSNITCSFVDEFQDNGAIVQYTKPIKEEMINYEQICNITDFISEISNKYSVNAWKLSGELSGIDNSNHKALYCNIKKSNGQIYTFRLAYEKEGEFSAYLYDVDESWKDEVEQVYLVELKKDGRYSKLGDIKMFY